MKALCFALLFAAVATPVLADEKSSDTIDWQPVTPKAQASDRFDLNRDGQFLMNKEGQLTVYGSYRSGGTGVAASATKNGDKWQPVMEISVGTGF
ncbi:MAG: hypothetical protein HY243_02740 [Proteobacteria bacterium]|nr:hypothetical protein [Pseudomonadota bacterium]